jgi:hypothetical protein
VIPLGLVASLCAVLAIELAWIIATLKECGTVNRKQRDILREARFDLKSAFIIAKKTGVPVDERWLDRQGRRTMDAIRAATSK